MKLKKLIVPYVCGIKISDLHEGTWKFQVALFKQRKLQKCAELIIWPVVNASEQSM